MTLPLRKATQTVKADAPRRFVFVLLDKFTMISFAGAIEPLRIANRVSGAALYAWVLCGEGKEASCSNGATFRLELGLEEMDRRAYAGQGGAFGWQEGNDPLGKPGRIRRRI